MGFELPVHAPRTVSQEYRASSLPGWESSETLKQLISLLKLLFGLWYGW